MLDGRNKTTRPDHENNRGKKRKRESEKRSNDIIRRTEASPGPVKGKVQTDDLSFSFRLETKAT